jgi:membrane protease YdiL (CAAX protease family)
MTSERPSLDGVPQFFLLVTVLSAPLWLVGAGMGFELLPGLPVSALAAFCPVAAATIVTFRRRRGVAALLARAFDFDRAPSNLWLLAAALLPFAWTAVALVTMLASGRALAPVAVSPVVVVLMILAFFVAALGEELGWSGFATEPLLQRWGWLRAALFLGLFWAVWHFVPLVEAHRNAQWIAWWTLGTVAQRIVMVWVFDKTGGSVFAVTLIHAGGNLCVFAAPGWYDPKFTSLSLAAIALIVVALERKTWRHRPARRAPSSRL